VRALDLYSTLLPRQNTRTTQAVPSNVINKLLAQLAHSISRLRHFTSSARVGAGRLPGTAASRRCCPGTARSRYQGSRAPRYLALTAKEQADGEGQGQRKEREGKKTTESGSWNPLCKLQLTSKAWPFIPRGALLEGTKGLPAHKSRLWLPRVLCHACRPRRLAASGSLTER
jgi:hypothetical protein